MSLSLVKLVRPEKDWRLERDTKTDYPPRYVGKPQIKRTIPFSTVGEDGVRESDSFKYGTYGLLFDEI